jgi:hypothetical protein
VEVNGIPLLTMRMMELMVWRVLKEVLWKTVGW